MDLSKVALCGPFRVTQSLPLRLSFKLDPDFMTQDQAMQQVRDQLPAPQLQLRNFLQNKTGRDQGPSAAFGRSQFASTAELELASPRPQHVIRLKGHGPMLFVYLETSQPVLRCAPGEPGCRELSVSLALDRQKFEESSKIAREKKIRKWAARQSTGHFIMLQDSQEREVALAVYEQPIVAQFPRKDGKDKKQWLQTELEHFPSDKVYDGFVSSMWFPGHPDCDIAQLDTYWRIFQVRQFERFTRAPSVRLDLDTVRGLRPGDVVGKWIDREPELVLGYDRALAKAGFRSVGNEGHNCVTDYGQRFSIPLRCPTPEEWDASPLPIPLDIIRGLRDTPPHSWHDEVMSYVGKRLTGMELGARNTSVESVPTAKLHQRCDRSGELPPQPCYDGPHLWQKRIGRYKIFAVQMDEGVVYLTDSNWRDKETAILFFASFDEAQEYCRGKRPNPPKWFGKRDHDHRDDWKSDLFDKIRSAMTRKDIVLQAEAGIGA